MTDINIMVHPREEKIGEFIRIFCSAFAVKSQVYCLVIRFIH